jgi:hypothetical protein
LVKGLMEALVKVDQVVVVVVDSVVADAADI